MPTEPLPIMLILRGIAGHFDGRDWPRGALYEAPASDYATARGYRGMVLDVSGETGPNNKQTAQALSVIHQDPTVTALYGFSGGGYNIRRILIALTPAERARMKLVVVLGAPRNPPALYRDGPWELVYRTDPPEGHMAGPRVLLAEVPHAAVVV